MGNRTTRPPRNAEEARKKRNAQKAALMRLRRAEEKQLGRALTQEERLALRTRGAILPTPQPRSTADSKDDLARRAEPIDGLKTSEEWSRIETTAEEMNRRHAGHARLMQEIALRRLSPKEGEKAPNMTWDEARRMLLDGMKKESECLQGAAGEEIERVQVREFTQVIIGHAPAVSKIHEALRMAREAKKAALAVPR